MLSWNDFGWDMKMRPLGDDYSKMKEDVAFRLEQAAKVGLGFELPPKITDVVRIVRKNEARPEVENAA